MRIKYDFEEEYNDVDLGEKLNYILSFPKRYIEHKLKPIKEDIDTREAENPEAHFLIGGVTEEEESISINGYGKELMEKINALFTEDDKIYLLMEVEDLLRHFRPK